jgi:hypothetical protein
MMRSSLCYGKGDKRQHQKSKGESGSDIHNFEGNGCSHNMNDEGDGDEDDGDEEAQPVRRRKRYSQP